MPKRLATALVLALTLALGSVPSADAASLRLGIYDCYTYDFSGGYLIFKGTVRFLSGTKYQHAWGRDGKKFDDPKTGKYVIKGRKIVFKTGTMKRTPGRIAKKPASGNRPWFQVLSDGEPSGIDCTYVKKP
jgi:hypothetical protein